MPPSMDWKKNLSEYSKQFEKNASKSKFKYHLAHSYYNLLTQRNLIKINNMKTAMQMMLDDLLAKRDVYENAKMYECVASLETSIAIAEYLLEKEKEQMFEYVKHCYVVPSKQLEFHEELFDEFYNQTYNQNK